MAYFHEVTYNGEVDSVLCDRCGFPKHHRPARPDDSPRRRLDTNPNWVWDPSPGWKWDFRWSSDPRPCDECGATANVRPPFSECVPEVAA